MIIHMMHVQTEIILKIIPGTGQLIHEKFIMKIMYFFW